jgi:hypothetical protein
LTINHSEVNYMAEDKKESACGAKACGMKACGVKKEE